jgi:3-oxoacyl-[acyl-carrier protein] reductase
MNTASNDELAGLNAVVTGSSSGIGRAIALQLADGGANVLVHAGKSHNAAAAVAADIVARGCMAHVVVEDITDVAGQDAFFAEVRRCYDAVDIWVNVAGADVLTGEATSWSFEQKLEQLWRVDVVATARLSRMAGDWMRSTSSTDGTAGSTADAAGSVRKTAGALLTIGWDQVEFGMAGDSGQLFAATKGAIMAFTKSLSLSLAPDVRVNCLAPGWIKTSWGATASPAWQDRARRESQLGRWGTPEDVAQMARFLVSPRAAFISGQIVNVNGGFRPSHQ